jgi:hypothetical protein
VSVNSDADEHCVTGILYIWISSYQIIFVQIYGFNLGENGLAFMASLLSLSTFIVLSQVYRASSLARSLRTLSSFRTSTVTFDRSLRTVSKVCIESLPYPIVILTLPSLPQTSPLKLGCRPHLSAPFSCQSHFSGLAGPRANLSTGSVGCFQSHIRFIRRLILNLPPISANPRNALLLNRRLPRVPGGPQLPPRLLSALRRVRLRRERLLPRVSRRRVPALQHRVLQQPRRRAGV